MNFEDEIGGDVGNNFERAGIPAPKIRTLNEYAAEVHEANAKWWSCLNCNGTGWARRHDPTGLSDLRCRNTACKKGRIDRNVGELLMLCTSELAEAMEGHRKNLPDDKLPHRRMFEVELADCVIRILDICGGMGLDLEGAYREKMAFNRVREDHKIEARLAENGKKY